jgi:hypothetical protein
MIEESHEATLLIATDGGANHGKGSYGVVISINEEVILTNKGRVPTTYTEPKSHSSEGFGILSGCIMYKYIADFKHEKLKYRMTNRVKIICDNEALVNTLNRSRKHKTTMKGYYAPDADVVLQILEIMNSLTAKYQTRFEIKHIKGHQDR